MPVTDTVKSESSKTIATNSTYVLSHALPTYVHVIWLEKSPKDV